MPKIFRLFGSIILLGDYILIKPSNSHLKAINASFLLFLRWFYSYNPLHRFIERHIKGNGEPSGLYYARMDITDAQGKQTYQETKKLLLMK